jgi:hypothetical protein
MKKLLFAILVAGFSWAAYWWVGATGAKSAFEGWFAERQAEGWVAETSDITVRGFPNRFDTTFSDLSLADPDTGLAWDMPFFQLFALSYQPNHLIAVWPHDQMIATPDEKLVLKSTDMRASLVVQPGAALALERSHLIVENAAVTSSLGWQSQAQQFRLAMQRIEGSESSYRFAVETTGFAPPSLFRLRVDPGQLLPDSFSALKADMTVSFDRQWDRFAIETARPQPVEIDLTLAQARWGELELWAAGKVMVDALGSPRGEITIRATNWREIIRLARDSGDLPAPLLDTVEGALSMLSGLAGNPKTLDIPLRLKGGKVLLGPMPVADAPRLVLR